MSPDARALVRLAAEIRQDLKASEARLDEARKRRGQLAAGDSVLASFFALSLHSYYTAIETIFERVARHFDGGIPGGERSHQELLETMVLELPGLRPPVLSAATSDVLRELLGFRHFVRHAYAVRWRTERLAELTDLAFATHPAVATELHTFLAFIDGLSAE